MFTSVSELASNPPSCIVFMGERIRFGCAQLGERQLEERNPAQNRDLAAFSERNTTAVREIKVFSRILLFPTRKELGSNSTIAYLA